MDDKKVMKYDKLVRDKIPEIIVNDGSECSFKKVDDDHFISYIEKKIQEELKEFKDDPSPIEAADILEILDTYFSTMIPGMNTQSKEVLKYKQNKKNERGGFDRHFILLESIKNGS